MTRLPMVGTFCGRFSNGWNFLPAVLLLLSVPQARAEEPAPLDALIEEALSANPELAAAENMWDAARARVRLARAWDDPMIGADVERDNNAFSDYMDVEYMASQRLPWFGRRRALSQAAAFDAEALGFRYLEKLRATRADTIAGAWDLWLADRRIEVNDVNVSLMRDFEAIARARYESGSGMQADLLRASIELSRMTNEVANLGRERATALAALNAVLGAPWAAPRSTAGLPKPADEAAGVETVAARAEDRRCALRAMERAVEGRAAAARAARLERRPMVELRVEGRQFQDGGGGIDEVDTGVFLNFPWIWKGKYDAMTAEAEADLAAARRELENEINMTRRDTHEGHTMADNSSRTFKLYRDSIVPESRRLVETTKSAYQAGTASFLELIESQRTLQDALMTMYETEAQWAKARAKLDVLAGPYGAAEVASGLVGAEEEGGP